MNRRLWSLIYVASLLGVFGCTKAPLQPVAYGGSATAQTGLTAVVAFETGVVTSSLYYPAWDPDPEKPEDQPVSYPGLRFGSEDQAEFARSLGSELDRIGLLNTAAADSGSTDVRILVEFVSTHHDPNDQVYQLDVRLEVTAADGGFAERYHVESRQTFWETFATGNAASEKVEAAQKLLDLIIDDIVAWAVEEGHTISG